MMEKNWEDGSKVNTKVASSASLMIVWKVFI